MSRDVPILEAAGLGRRTPDGRWLFRGLNIRLNPGDRVAVTGPSGSGKSLLLRCLALLDTPDEGRVLWRGEVLRGDSIPTFRAGVIYLHQTPALGDGCVRDALAVPFGLAAHRGRDFDPVRVLDWFGNLGRDPTFLDKPCRDLSGGEAQLTAFVRTLQLDPEVMLLDEPTSALDQRTASALEGLTACWLGERTGHRAYVWVTHDASQAARVATRTVRLPADGTEG